MIVAKGKCLYRHVWCDLFLDYLGLEICGYKKMIKKIIIYRNTIYYIPISSKMSKKVV